MCWAAEEGVDRLSAIGSYLCLIFYFFLILISFNTFQKKMIQNSCCVMDNLGIFSSFY